MRVITQGPAERDDYPPRRWPSDGWTRFSPRAACTSPAPAPRRPCSPATSGSGRTAAGAQARADGGRGRPRAGGRAAALRLPGRHEARQRPGRLGRTPGGQACLDAGASTGGFTDCLLQRGAESVIALDVAYGELHWRLRQDPRVAVVERTNVRDLDPGALPFRPDLLVADLSFISLRRRCAPCWAAPPALRLPGLVKPSSSWAADASGGEAWCAPRQTAGRPS